VSDLSAWILSIGLFLGVVVLTALAAKSLAGDPARGRRRCPRCWHDLGPIRIDEAPDPAAASRRCAECGFTAAREQDTMRTRRRPVRAALAIVGVVALILAARVRLIDAGAWSIAPSAVLLAAAPWIDSAGYDSPIGELARRIGSGTLGAAQVDAALELFVRGDGGARPPSPAWQMKYRRLGDALVTGMPRDDLRLLRLLEIPPALVLEVHEGGDAGAHALAIDLEAWWPHGTEGEATVRFGDGSTARAAYDPWGRNAPWLLRVPAGVAATDPIALELRARPRGFASMDAPDGGWLRYDALEARGTRVVGRAPGEPAAEPIDSAALRAAIAAVFDFDDGFVLWSGGAPRGGLRFNERATSDAEFAGTLIGLRIDICEDGVARRTSRIWWLAGPTAARPRWFPPEEDDDALARLHAQEPSLDARWTIRVTADETLADLARPALAEQPTRTFRRWSGSLELPLRIQRVMQPSPPRRWAPAADPAGN